MKTAQLGLPVAWTRKVDGVTTYVRRADSTLGNFVEVGLPSGSSSFFTSLPEGCLPLYDEHQLRFVIEDLTEAIRLIWEYVTPKMLPAVEGWSQYDALAKYAPDKLSPFVELWEKVRPRPGDSLEPDRSVHKAAQEELPQANRQEAAHDVVSLVIEYELGEDEVRRAGDIVYVLSGSDSDRAWSAHEIYAVASGIRERAQVEMEHRTEVIMRIANTITLDGPSNLNSTAREALANAIYDRRDLDFTIVKES